MKVGDLVKVWADEYENRVVGLIIEIDRVQIYWVMIGTDVIIPYNVFELKPAFT